MEKPRKGEILNPSEQHTISHAISLAENRTSGEIRVCVEHVCQENTLEKAKYYFKKLGMENTTLRNGVLFYLAIDDRKFAILGDKEIDLRVPEDFWEETKELMKGYFVNNQIVEGLIAGIEQAGKRLKQYFPIEDDDINELPNDPVQF